MKTLAQLIADSARETAAPSSFAESVARMFVDKGIALDEDATPYEAAIHETFRCEQKIRLESERARDGIERLKERLARLGESWERQLGEVDRLRKTMNDRARELRDQALWLRAQRGRMGSDTVRPLVVPGPKDIQ